MAAQYGTIERSGRKEFPGLMPHHVNICKFIPHPTKSGNGTQGRYLLITTGAMLAEKKSVPAASDVK